MKKTATLFLVLLVSLSALAQVDRNVTIERDIPLYLSHVFNPLEASSLWINPLKAEKDRLMPEPKGLNNALTKKLDHERMMHMQSSIIRHGNFTGEPTDKSTIIPKTEKEFSNFTGGGTPNDNHVAVGNDGKVIAVLNTTIRVYDSTGKFIKVWSLESFTAPNGGNTNIDTLPTLTRTYDPRVIYCPNEDRYILLYMHGITDATSFIVMGFSSSNNPLDPWNVYKIPGKPTKDSVWSDYPIVSQTKEDLFFTVNLLLNGTSWEEGFTEAVIWQLNKEDGFNGKTLGSNLFKDIKYEGVSVWSICPIQNGPMPNGSDNYFMSVRPYSEMNDTVFLHRITNTQRSGTAKYEQQLLISDVPYGYPPSALQPDTAFKLRTNDVRVLSGIRVGDQIQYMQNCMNFSTKQAHITHNTIYDLGTSPFIRGRLITHDSLDYGYPAIASAGIDEGDPSSIITMVHSGPWNMPGTSMIYNNRYGELSDPVKVKKGESLIYYTFLGPANQRWGDYEGIQRKYNEKGVYYLIGSYGANNRMYSWVARVKLKDKVWETPVQNIKVFPVPAQSHLDIEWINTKEGNYEFLLYTLDGRKVSSPMKYYVPAGTHLYRINTLQFSTGAYVLRINAGAKEVFTTKVLID